MAVGDTKSDMTKPGRHVYGPRPLSAVVPGIARPAFRRTPAAAAQVIIDWPMIVGPVLATQTAPRRFASGTLTIACAGPVAMQLQHMAIEVMSRINTHVGMSLVRSLRFVQVGYLAPRPPATAPVSPQTAALADSAVSSLPPGELRDALRALGQAVLTHRGRKPSTDSANRR